MYCVMYMFLHVNVIHEQAKCILHGQMNVNRMSAHEIVQDDKDKRLSLHLSMYMLRHCDILFGHYSTGYLSCVTVVITYVLSYDTVVSNGVH